MSQDKPNEHEDTKEWETWMDNLIIEDTLQKENIPFYQYSEFENVKLISGNIYEAFFKISRKTIALKCIKRHRKLEIHDNILKFYGITKQENANNYMIILEYSNNGSLRQYLKTNFQKMDWNTKLNLAKQISNVLMYLHSNEIIHGKLIKRHRKLEIHDNILKFYGITKQENANNYMIILEYSNNGSLRQYLKTNFQKMDWNTKLNLAKQISNVLMYLHSNEIIHGKLNSENILVQNGNIKLNVFGLTKIMPESLNFLQNTLGPIQYIDPQYLEIFGAIGKNKSSDIFSLGIILWEISSGNSPFEMEPSSNIDLLNNIVKGKREMIIQGTPPKYKEIYTDCWKHNGNSRPDISQVFKNLSEIIIPCEGVEIKTPQLQPYNVTDEVISVKSEISNKQKEKEVKSDPPFVDVADEVNIFIKDLFEFFIDSYEKQDLEIHSIMVKNYIREHNKNPVEILYEMISNQSHSHYRLASLIGFFYKNGIGTIVDNKMAFKFFSLATNEIINMKNTSPNSLSLRKLHENNREIGSIYLADMHLDGLGVKKNRKEAFKISSKVANEGSIRALEFVAMCYEFGCGVKKNEKKAFELNLWSAEEGCPVGQSRVSCCHIGGMGTAVDYSEAFKWAMISALSGNIFAMKIIGLCYSNGVGMGRDYEAGFKWFSKAAEKECSVSQYLLGHCYKNGEGIDKDEVKAFEWFKKSAENDHITAQYWIGKCFYEGYGTGKDTVKAIYWLNKAKENENMDANKLLEEIINKIV
ncbi:hypothetical protein Glove_232g45 [Diversispora epigaea]|uniref:Protein kinase domain-containing protein n=1 Tax=Diversispora epigaea TaxID=1348612 RepID=A0A397IFZ2_9GLOM|nr:hypothetical protein Glove_232g45 [Diversispora epigaea]